MLYPLQHGYSGACKSMTLYNRRSLICENGSWTSSRRSREQGHGNPVASRVFPVRRLRCPLPQSSSPPKGNFVHALRESTVIRYNVSLCLESGSSRRGLRDATNALQTGCIFFLHVKVSIPLILICEISNQFYGLKFWDQFQSLENLVIFNCSGLTVTFFSCQNFLKSIRWYR